MIKQSDKKPLKVGLVFDDSLDRPDGVQQYVRRIAEQLTEYGHEVHFLVGETTSSDLANIHSLARNLRVRFNGNMMSMPLPTHGGRLQKLLNDKSFDVLHVQMPYSPFMAGKIVKLAPEQTAVVGTFHILPYSKGVVAGNKILSLLNGRSGRRFDEIMAVSPPAKDFAKKMYGYDSTIVPNPIRVSDFTMPATEANDSPKIVFLGRLVERKGAMQLLKAIAYIKEHDLFDGDFKVVIAGKGEQLEPLKNYAIHNGVGDMVSFPGFIAEEDKAALLASADIAVFPSISGESFGISIVEALAAASGVMLAGNNPGYASVLHGMPELLIDPMDVEGFAATLAHWLADAKGRKSISAKQRRYARQYDIALVGKKVEDVYYKALQSRRSS